MTPAWSILRRAAQRLAGSALGASGERSAERWLRKNRYRILKRNLKLGDDEIDLLALDPDGVTLVIVEVKTRAADNNAPLAPEEAVGLVKQRRLSRIAARLGQSKRYAGRPMRFDVIAVLWPEEGTPTIRHIPAAFESSL